MTVSTSLVKNALKMCSKIEITKQERDQIELYQIFFLEKMLKKVFNKLWCVFLLLYKSDGMCIFFKKKTAVTKHYFIRMMLIRSYFNKLLLSIRVFWYISNIIFAGWY